MKQSLWMKVRPHLIAVGIFLALSVIYCSPALKGLVVNQHDTLGWKGMAQQSFEFKEKYGHFPLWTNSMFSGMPAYQIAMESDTHVSYNYLGYIFQLGLPQPINFFFLACISFYILCMAMRINPWVAILASIAYSFSTYDAIIIAVGHVTKMLALGYAPLVLAGLLLLYEKKYWIGAVLFGAGLSLQVGTAHLQVVYYTALICGAISLGYLVIRFREKQIASLLKGLGIAVLLAVAALGVNALSLLLTSEFAKESMRGGTSELRSPQDKNSTPGGLDKDYAFQWSYGIPETATLILPSFNGGGNQGHQYSSSKFAEKLGEIGYPEEDALQAANGSSYWGTQPTTSGPVYIGAIICLLSIIGMFTLKTWHKWWILAIGIFGIMLAWGNNLPSFNYFLFDHLPLYKKFRVPTMALVIPQIVFCLLAGLTLQDLLFGKSDQKEREKKLKKAGIVTGVIMGVLLVYYFNADFTGRSDASLRENLSNSMLQQLSKGANPTAAMQQQAMEFGRSFTRAIQEDRKGLYLSDWIRSLVLIGLAFAGLFFYNRGKLKAQSLLAALIVLSTFDLWMVDKRYLSEAEFVDKDSFDSAVPLTNANRQILQDTGYYRVFAQEPDWTQESRTSYYHNSIGGYSPAKLQIYQDLIDSQLSKGNMQVFDMLNTKYFIIRNPQNGQPVAQLNPGAFGPAWLVKGIKFVPDPRAEMAALDSTDLRDTAVIRESERNLVTSLPQYDSSAAISLLYNRNDSIAYNFHAAAPQFAVFSEIYYDKGWKAWIDQQPATIVRVNYALRGLSIPAGNHRIEFRFEPANYHLGNQLQVIFSLLLYIVTIAALFFWWKKYKKEGNPGESA